MHVVSDKNNRYLPSMESKTAHLPLHPSQKKEAHFIYQDIFFWFCMNQEQQKWRKTPFLWWVFNSSKDDKYMRLSHYTKKEVKVLPGL